MTTKWTIRKYPIREDGLRPLFPWFVFPPGVTPPDDHKKAFLTPSDIRATFSEALACVEYQIRKARIVEVDLPKVERKAYIDDDPFSELIIVERLEYGAQVAIRDGSVEQIFRLSGANLKPLAEYLLALHYEKENR